MSVQTSRLSVQTTVRLTDTCNKSSSNVSSNNDKKPEDANNTTSPNADSTFENAQKQLKNIQKFYKDTLSEVNMMMGLGWGDFGFKEKYTPIIAERRKADSSFIANFISNNIQHGQSPHKILLYNKEKRKLIDSLYIPPDPKNSKDSLQAFLNKKYKVEGYATFWEKISYVLSHLTIRDLIGFLITALAITLGAPFWFDLLNRFVNIRAGGNKPSEDSGSSNSSAASKTITLNQKPSPNSFA